MMEAMGMIEQPKEKRLEVIFPEENYIRANDLQGFLFYFNMYYMLFKSKSNTNKDIRVLLNQKEELRKSFRFTKKDYLNYSKEIYSDLNDLLIYEIEKHSPLEIIFGGSIVALVSALILSGGTVEIDISKGVFKANIHQSLGKSLKELKSFLKD